MILIPACIILFLLLLIMCAWVGDMPMELASEVGKYIAWVSSELLIVFSKDVSKLVRSAGSVKSACDMRMAMQMSFCKLWIY